MTNVLLRRAAMALALAALLPACGRKDDAAPVPVDAAATAPAATTAADNVGREAAAASTAEESAMRPAEVDAYARGMQKELALLKAAGDTISQARAKGDKDAEANALMEMATIETEVEGAKASGLAPARYQFVKSVVDGVLGKADMQAMMKSMGAQADAADLPPEQRDQAADGRAEMEAGLGDPYQGMAADVADAFKARQAELAQLRAQVIGARLNAAR